MIRFLSFVLITILFSSNFSCTAYVELNGMLPKGEETVVSFHPKYKKPDGLTLADQEAIIRTLRKVDYYHKEVMRIQLLSEEDNRRVRVQFDGAYVVLEEFLPQQWKLISLTYYVADPENS